MISRSHPIFLLKAAIAILVIFLLLGYSVASSAGRALDDLEQFSKLDRESCSAQPLSACPSLRCMIMKNCRGYDICTERVGTFALCLGKHSHGAAPCCPIYKKICPSQVTETGGCAVDGYNFPLCVPCGNGTCNRFENRCNCPEDCLPTKERPKIRYEPPYELQKFRPNLGFSYEKEFMDEDLPSRLLSAFEKKDATLCDKIKPVRSQQTKLPTPDDAAARAPSVYTSPSTEIYRMYCRALAIRDIDICYQIPYLGMSRDCAKILSLTSSPSPTRCLQHAGSRYADLDEVRRCYKDSLEHFFEDYSRRTAEEIAVADNIDTLKSDDFSMMKCLEIDTRWTHNKQIAPSPDKCIFDLALQLKNSNICKLIPDPYDGPDFPWSRNNCAQELQNNGDPQ